MAKKANKRDKSYTRVIVGCFMVFFIFVVGICVYKQSRELYNLKKEELRCHTRRLLRRKLLSC